MQIVLGINQKKISAVKIEVNGICLNFLFFFIFKLLSTKGIVHMKSVHSEVCGLSRVKWPLFLERDVAAGLGVSLFNALSPQKPNSIHIHCIRVVAEIPETDTLKCRRMKPKLDR